MPVLLGLVVLERDFRDIASDVDLAEERNLDQVFRWQTEQCGDILQEGAVIVCEVRGLILGVLQGKRNFIPLFIFFYQS